MTATNPDDPLWLLRLTLNGGSGTGGTYTGEAQRLISESLAARQERRSAVRRAVLEASPPYELFEHTDNAYSSSRPGTYYDVFLAGTVKIGRVARPRIAGEPWTGEMTVGPVYGGGPRRTSGTADQAGAVAEVIIEYACYELGVLPDATEHAV